MSKEWKMVRLGGICDIQAGGTPSRSRNEYWNNGNIPWVKISDIKSKYLDSTSEYITNLGLDNSSAKIFKKGTILYTIFATLGEVAILSIDATTNQAIAGINIKNESNLDKDYLYHYLVSIRKDIEKIGRGVAQNNINMGILRNFTIPAPPIETQRHIATTLDKASELIILRKKQLQELDTLAESAFYDMFGDPVKNEKGWEKKKISILGTLARGKSKHRPRNAPELLGGKYPLIQTGDIANANLYINSYNQTYSDLGLLQSKLWGKGTLCITIAANIAKTAILNIEACFPDSVVGFIASERTNNIFIHYWFSFFQEILEKQAPEVAQKNINLDILNKLEVIYPPLSLQTRFATIIEKIEQQKILAKKALQESEDLFQRLMQDLFKPD